MLAISDLAETTQCRDPSLRCSLKKREKKIIGTPPHRTMQTNDFLHAECRFRFKLMLWLKKRGAFACAGTDQLFLRIMHSPAKKLEVFWGWILGRGANKLFDFCPQGNVELSICWTLELLALCHLWLGTVEIFFIVASDGL